LNGLIHYYLESLEAEYSSSGQRCRKIEAVERSFERCHSKMGNMRGDGKTYMTALIATRHDPRRRARPKRAHLVRRPNAGQKSIGLSGENLFL
jgi:hypothetical protein